MCGILLEGQNLEKHPDEIRLFEQLLFSEYNNGNGSVELIYYFQLRTQDIHRGLLFHHVVVGKYQLNAPPSMAKV